MNKKNKLPKYWAVKLTKENQKLFKSTVVKYLNETYGLKFPSAWYDYFYGYNGMPFVNADVSKFTNIPTILSLKKFIELSEDIVDELPIELPKEYIIECTTAKETNIAANYFKDYVKEDWSHHKYVYVVNKYGYRDMLFTVIREDVKHIPIIKFEDWYSLIKENTEVNNTEANKLKWCIKLTEESKPILKEWLKQQKDFDKDYLDSPYGWVICDNYRDNSYQMWGVNETPKGYTEITLDYFIKNIFKQMLGYKLKDNCKQFEKAAVAICKANGGTIDNFKLRHDGTAFSSNSKCSKSLNEAGVLNLWFEPVYKMFEVNDWIIVTNCKSPTAIKITEVTNDYYRISYHPHVLGIARDGSNVIRKATQKEIDDVIKIDLNKIFKTYCPNQELPEWTKNLCMEFGKQLLELAATCENEYFIKDQINLIKF